MDAQDLHAQLCMSNQVVVSPDEMLHLLSSVEALPPSASYEDAGRLVRHLFPCNQDKQRVALLRCHALVETLDRECHWLHHAGTRQAMLMEPAMGVAAARCALVITNGALVFDRAQFLQHTLAATKPAGHA